MYKVINLDETFYRISGNQIKNLHGKREFLHSILVDYTRWFGNITDATRTYPEWQITGNDIVRKYINGYNAIYTLRDVEYFDGYGRRINPRDYLPEAMRTVKLRYYIRGRRVSHHYRYRMDPVPYTGKIKGGCSGTKKFRGLKRIYQQASDPEYGKYIRKKALPVGPYLTWDYEAYEETRLHESWKKQKKRKQWM
ncbi:hypothetical protein [Hungatella hathewayi]|uniref:hypothetical protein n=1 Tax=Hungatella hathewayi TaxID=154046 RepID=UPI0035660E26